MKKIVLCFAFLAVLVMVSCTADSLPSSPTPMAKDTSDSTDTGGQTGDPHNPRPKP